MTSGGVTRMYVVGICTLKGQERTVLLDLDVTPGDTTTGTPPRFAGSINAAPTKTVFKLRTFTMCSVMVSGTTAVLPGSIVTNASSDEEPGNDGRIGLMQVTLDYSLRNVLKAEEFGESLYLASGSLSGYDGANVFEVGFPYFPGPYSNGTGLTVVTAGGGTLSAGTYEVCFEYQWRDMRGVLHRSAPSVPVSVTATAGQKLTCTVPTMTCTAKQEAGMPAIAIVEYRTQANGTIFYRVTPDTVPTSNLNVTNAPTITFDDKSSDTDIGDNSLLDTTGGDLESVCPPGGSFVNVYRNRLWSGGGDDPRNAWYTRLYITGEAPSFHEVQTLSVDEGGPVIAHEVLDDTDIIFKTDRIFALIGDGPTDSGDGVDYVVRKIASDTGCIEPRSIVLTPMGLMFQSAQGICLLDRSMQVNFIGKAVQDTVASLPICTSAVLVPAQNQVRFTFVNAAMNDGLGVWFDYVSGQWSTTDMNDNGFYGNRAPAASAVLWPQPGTTGVYVWVTPVGRVFSETTSYIDGSLYTKMTVETPNIRPTGVQGFHRFRKVQVLMTKGDNHDLKLEVAYDGSQTYTESVTWTAAQINALPREELQYRLQRPRAEAVRFRITDLTPTGASFTTGRGPILEALAIEWVGKTGPARLAAGARK
jgi:hypothetical protein